MEVIENRKEEVLLNVRYLVKLKLNKTSSLQYQSTILNMTSTSSPKAAGV